MVHIKEYKSSGPIIPYSNIRWFAMSEHPEYLENTNAIGMDILCEIEDRRGVIIG